MLHDDPICQIEKKQHDLLTFSKSMMYHSCERKRSVKHRNTITYVATGARLIRSEPV